MSIQLIGGPTVLLEIGGLRLLTDPAFDGRLGRGVDRLRVIAAGERITL